MTICVVWCQCILAFFSLFWIFLHFLGQLDHRKITCFEKIIKKKILVQVAPEPSTVEMLRDLVSTLDNHHSLPQLGRLPVHHHLCESLLGDRNTLQLTRPCVCPQLQGHQTSCITLSWYILFSLCMILFVFLWSSCWRQPHHLFSPPQCLTSSTLQLSYPSWQWGLLCCQKIFVVSSCWQVQ